MESMTTNCIQHKNKKLKLRKPAVEKLRRDRINSSIEKLKLLLKEELKAKQPSSKLEKADVLETTVTYLKSRTQEQSYADGFARCLKETACFLSTHNQLTSHKPAATKPKSRAQTCISMVPQGPLDNTQLWRPW